MKKLKNAAKFLSILLLLLAAVTFGAIAADADTVVARVGENTYTSLEDAIAAAKDGDKVYVLADTTLDRTPITKSITLESEGTGRYTVTLVDKTTVGRLTGIGELPMVGVVEEMITVAEDAVLNIKNIVLNAKGAADRPMGVYGVLGVAGSAEIIGNEHGEVLLASDTSLRMVGDFTGAIKVDLDGVTDQEGVEFGVADGVYAGSSNIVSSETEGLSAAIVDGRLVFVRAVAQVGSALYASLTEAIEAVGLGGTVTLLRDVITTLSDTLTISQDKNLTIDLAGHEVSFSSVSSIAIANCGELVIADSSAEKTGVLAYNYTGALDAGASATIYNAGTLTVSGGTIKNTSTTAEQGIGVKAESGSVFNFFGGTITGCSAYGAYISENATVNVKGSATASDNAKNLYLVEATSLVLAGNFVGNIGITLADVTVKDGTVFGSVESESYTGASYFFADGAKTDFISAFDGTNLIFTVPSGEVLKYMNLCLDGQIGVKLYYDLSAALKDGSFNENTVLAFYIGETRIDRMTVGEAILDSDGLYIFECKVNAAQMADTISFHFENDGKMVGTAYQTSVRTYAEYIIRADNNEELGVAYEEYVAIQYLMYAMLNYGAMAQNQTGYNTDNLADADLSPLYGDFKDKHKDLPDFSDAPTFTSAETWFEIEKPAGDEQPPFQFESVSIGLNSTTSMKFYFKTDDLSRYTFCLLYIEEFDNGAMYLIEESLAVYANKDGDGYFIEIVNIPACYLDHAYRIEVIDYGGQVFAVEATVLAYVQAQLENLENPENEQIDKNLVNLMKAIYYYNQAANKYFGY